MKLAEALARRRQLTDALTYLRGRLRPDPGSGSGVPSPEEARALLAEAEAVLAEMEALTVWIEKTLLGTTLPDGMTLLEALAHLDTLRIRGDLLREAAAVLPAGDAAALRERDEENAERLRMLKERLQAAGAEAELQD